jgi:hypothetical protein
MANAELLVVQALRVAPDAGLHRGGNGKRIVAVVEDAFD